MFISGGNAYRWNADGVIESTAVLSDGKVDDHNWGEVTNWSEGPRKEYITQMLIDKEAARLFDEYMKERNASPVQKS